MCCHDLCVTTTCFFASSTLKLGGGGRSTACTKPKNQYLTKKRPFLAGVHEKWHILVLTEALNLLQFTRDLAQHTRPVVPVLCDENIHYRICKLMYGEKTTGWNVRLFLRSHPILYGFWHAYKFCVTQTFRSFWRMVTFFRKGLLQSGEGERLTPDAPRNSGRHPPRGRPFATPTTKPSRGEPGPDRPPPKHARRSKGPGQDTRRGTDHVERPYQRPVPGPREVRTPHHPGGGERTPLERERTHTQRAPGDYQKGNRTELAERTDREDWRTSERG